MLKGSIVALITPFNKNGSVNYNKLVELIEFHVKSKTDGIVLLGTTAESSTLTLDEKKEIVRIGIKTVNKRIPVIVGSGTNDTNESVMLSKEFSNMGADYLLVITPYYNKTNENGLIKHFNVIADSSSCPIILYNVPSRTGMNISENVIKVVSKHKNIYGIKEASSDMSYATKVSKYLSDEFIMLSGNDDIIVPMMSIGSLGVISVLANVAPTQTHNICKLCLERKYDEARIIAIKLLDFTNALFIETNPIPIKEAMNELGFSVGGYRLPLDFLSPNNKQVLIDNMIKAKGEIFWWKYV